MAQTLEKHINRKSAYLDNYEKLLRNGFNIDKFIEHAEVMKNIKTTDLGWVKFCLDVGEIFSKDGMTQEKDAMSFIDELLELEERFRK